MRCSHRVLFTFSKSTDVRITSIHLPRVVVVLVALLGTAGGETEEAERHADALAHPAPAAAAAARAPDAAAAAATEMPVRKGVAWLGPSPARVGHASSRT